VKDDPRTDLAKTPKPVPEQPKAIDPVFFAMNETLTLAAAAVINNDAEALQLITEALATVRAAIEQ